MRLSSIARLAPRANLALPRVTPLRRLYSSDADSSMTPTEAEIASSLSSNDTLKPTHSVLVRDVSGGCGSMYAIDIASQAFKGKGLLQQQRLVTKALGERVKEWHGVQIRTSLPPTE